VSILLLAAVHCLKSIKLRLDLTALYIAGECAFLKSTELIWTLQPCYPAVLSGQTFLPLELIRIGPIGLLYCLSIFGWATWLHTLPVLFDERRGNVLLAIPSD
jgi:hypothetical protein